MPGARASQKRRERPALRPALGAALALLCLVLPGRADAADRLVLQLRWRPQAEFAGYYAAQKKGYYRRQGLAVAIQPGGPGIDPARVLAAGGAEVAVDWLASALAARERGRALVNIAQIFDRAGAAGAELVCRRSSGLSRPADLKGKRIAVGFAGGRYPLLAFLAKLGLETTGARPEVRVVRESAGAGLLASGRADCLATASYDESGPGVDAGFSPRQRVVFRYAEAGAATLGDGLYALQERLEDAVMRERLARFERASFAGWRFALAHPREAARMVPPARGSIGGEERRLGAVGGLIAGGWPSLGYLDPLAYRRNVALLLALKSRPVITKAPVAAWTHQIWKDAMRR
jgi:NitT/TauT family transport system substrate-binding protein